MPSSADYRLQAERFESFLKIIKQHASQYREWIVTTEFYIALQYVDAFLLTRKRKSWRNHEDRLIAMGDEDETDAIADDYERLYKFSREGRYDCAPFTDRDLREEIEPLYLKIRDRMRRALGLAT